MFQSLIYTPLMQALGSAIIASIWQSLILLIIYRSVCFLNKDLKAAAKYNLAVIGVLVSFALFIISFLSQYLKDGASATPPIITARMSDEPSVFVIPQIVTGILSVSYLLLLICFLVKLFLSVNHVNRLKQSSIQAEKQLLDFTLESAAFLKIRRKISLLISNRINVPATIGFIKPVILLPAACITQLSPDQLEAVILHELSHIRRNDYLLNLILTTFETLLFFNPAVMFLMNVVRRERENCCDDIVLSQNQDPVDYAEALLVLGKLKLQPTMAMHAVSHKGELLKRIKRITGSELNERSNYAKRILSLSLIMALLFIFYPLLNHTQQEKENNGIPAVAVTAEVPSDYTSAISSAEELPKTIFKKSEKKSVSRKPNPDKDKPGSKKQIAEVNPPSVRIIADSVHIIPFEEARQKKLTRTFKRFNYDAHTIKPMLNQAPQLSGIPNRINIDSVLNSLKGNIENMRISTGKNQYLLYQFENERNQGKVKIVPGRKYLRVASI